MKRIETRYVASRFCILGCNGCYLRMEPKMENRAEHTSPLLEEADEVMLYHYLNHYESLRDVAWTLRHDVENLVELLEGKSVLSYMLILDVALLHRLLSEEFGALMRPLMRITSTTPISQICLSFHRHVDINLVEELLKLFHSSRLILAYVDGYDNPSLWPAICDLSEKHGLNISYMVKKPDPGVNMEELQRVNRKAEESGHRMQIDTCLLKHNSGYDCTRPDTWSTSPFDPVVGLIGDEGYYPCAYMFDRCLIGGSNEDKSNKEAV